MTTDFRLIPHATQRHARKLAIGGLGNRLTQRGFTYTWRPYQTQNRPFEFLHPLLNREVFQNTFLNFFQTVMIFVKNFLCFAQVFGNFAAFFPRAANQGVDIVSDHGGFRRHGRHHLQLVQLGSRLLFGLGTHTGFFNLVFEIFDFVWRIVHITQLFLNRFHLLIQIVLALTFFHLLLNAATNTLFNL